MFLLYRIDQERGFYELVGRLRGQHSLWGPKGSVARCAGASKHTQGPWQVTEAELLADLLPRMRRGNDQPASDFALLEYLVSGPELLIARLVKVTGFLRHNYNPILFTFQEVLAASPEASAALRARTTFPLVTVPIPQGPTRVIRRVSYLVKEWDASAFLGGALWWPEHWEYFRGLGAETATPAGDLGRRLVRDRRREAKPVAVERRNAEERRVFRRRSSGPNRRLSRPGL